MIALLKLWVRTGAAILLVMVVAWLAMVVAGLGSAYGQTGHPAAPAPAIFWGELEARPPFVDSTGFGFGTDPGCTPWAFDLAVDQGLMAAANGNAVTLYRLDTLPTHRKPSPIGTACRSGGMLIPFVPNGDTDWHVGEVELVHVGGRAIVVAVWIAGQGLVVYDTQPHLRPIYQDPTVGRGNAHDSGLAVARVDGRWHAFASDGADHVYAYDLHRAASLQFPCVVGTGACPNVAKGRVQRGPNPIQGRQLYAAGDYLFTTSGSQYRLWRFVGDPLAPIDVSGRVAVHGIWRWSGWLHNGEFFAAGVDGQRTHIYRVTNGRALMATVQTPGAEGSRTNTVRGSKAGGRVLLWVGFDHLYSNFGGGQREYPLDATDPEHPRDLTPPTGYWGWYYATNPTGFHHVAGAHGQLVRLASGREYICRAARSVADCHEVVDEPGEPPPPPPPVGARIFSDGFEGGNTGRWTVVISPARLSAGRGG